MRIQNSLAHLAPAVALWLVFGSTPALADGQGRGNGDDCNNNKIPDDIEIEQGLAEDCNANGIPDECDIADGTSQDCNEDGVPDECLICPPVDIVFVMDTSGSMDDEGQALCNSIGQVEADLEALGIDTQVTILGITQGASPDFPCLQDTVLNLLGPDVPGSGGDVLDDSEDWGPATAIVAQEFGWLPGAVRVVVPISDEGAQDGDPCDDPGEDRDAVENAIQIANQNNVVVSPIAGTGSDQCVITLMSDIAMDTGGTAFISTDPDADLPGAIFELVIQACQQSFDCNENGIPDECDIADGTSGDCNGNGIPDECDGGCGGTDVNCEEFDRFEDLTAEDTLTLLTWAHNPESEQGYVYVYAVDEGNAAIGFDWLIGQQLVVNGLEAFEYSINAVDYRAGVDQGMSTDIDGDDIRDLNGTEYELTAGELLVPRFLGQIPQQVRGELILIGLSGGREFDTAVDFLIYNDNEVAFSAEHTFRCWDKVPLTNISAAFEQEFLANWSGDDEDEDLEGLEYGWFRMNGGVANSVMVSLPDPAFYGVYVEGLGGYHTADLPFERCLQSGHLLPRDAMGDNEEMDGQPSDENCDLSIGRRHPGSLLLYPEFDNRAGIVSVLTITNTSPTDGTRVHFKYVGRFGN